VGPLGSDRYPLFARVFSLNYREGQGMTLPDVILTEDPYPVKGMIVSGGNPMMLWPDPDKVGRALDRLEFLVVMDVFMSETAKRADIVLPASTCFERVELVDSGPLVGIPYVMLRKPAVEPLHESWPDWKFCFTLADRLGYQEYFPWKDAEEAIDHLLEPTKLSVAQLKQKPEGMAYTRTYQSYLNGGFKTPSGKVELYSDTLERCGYDPLPAHVEPPESPISTPEVARDYPLVLSTGARVVEYIHAQLRNIPSLRKCVPKPVATIHPDTARQWGVADGSRVRVETPRGSVEMVARVTDNIMPGVVDVPHGWENANVNILVDPGASDPISGFPAVKALLCRLAPVSS
jgi:anaerobic selenocysteine-containing dehydrogenase